MAIDLYEALNLPRPVAPIGSWSVADLTGANPAGAMLVLDAVGDPVAWATTDTGQIDWTTAPGARSAREVMRNARVIAAAFDLLAVARQLAAHGPCLLTMLRAAGQEPPLGLMTAVVLAQRLVTEMPQ
jgi:hypothetical protein